MSEARPANLHQAHLVWFRPPLHSRDVKGRSQRPSFVFSKSTMSSSSDMRLPPAILYGTAWKKDTTAGLVYTALKTGFRGIDTACQPKHYR